MVSGTVVDANAAVDAAAPVSVVAVEVGAVADAAVVVVVVSQAHSSMHEHPGKGSRHCIEIHQIEY